MTRLYSPGVVAIGLIMGLMLTVSANAYDGHRLSTPLVIDGRTVPLAEFAIYRMPGESISIAFEDAADQGLLRFLDAQIPVGGGVMKAPSTPGLYQLQVENTSRNETALVRVFTLVPMDGVDKKGYLNGYRIGAYPSSPLRNNPIYLPPAGFVEVTEDNLDTRLSPNFLLRDFVSKQGGAYPRYVVLRASLLLKLENILASLNRAGMKTERLVIMSGFRTPWYNKSIGNVAYSRHVWGGAADIYIDDKPQDGRMDDLNGDGKINRDDAKWLANFINAKSERGEFGPRIGGLGVYGSTAAHGPFVHVDVRGVPARW